jgi:hypothetical protein
MDMAGQFITELRHWIVFAAQLTLVGLAWVEDIGSLMCSSGEGSATSSLI